MAFVGSYLSASNGQILILSGATTTAKSPDESDYVDTNLFVSGSANSRGTLVRGTALFGGDLHISGNLTVDGTAPGGGGGGAPDVGWFGQAAGTIFTTGSLRVGSAADDSSTDISLSDGGAAVFNEQGADADFRVESDKLTGMIIVDGGTNQIILHSSGVAALDAGGEGIPAPTDVATYISGAIGSQGASNSKGTTLITGDLVVSGGIENGVVFNDRGAAVSFRVELDGVQNAFRMTGDSVHVNPDGQNVGFLVGGYGTSQPALSIDENGLYINDSQLDQNFRVETNDLEGAILVDGGENQVFLHLDQQHAGHAGGTDIPAGSDVGTYISGTVGSAGDSNSKGVTLITGDTVVSGGLHGGYSAEMAGDILTLASNVVTGPGVFFFNGENDWRTEGLVGPDGNDVVFSISGSIGRMGYLGEEEMDGIACIGGDLVVSGNTYLAMKKSGPGSDLKGVGTDVNFFVSGSAGSAGGQGSGKGTAVFGGDLMVSGNAYVSISDDSASSGPTLHLGRDSSSPADDDEIGVLQFDGRTSNGQFKPYATIVGVMEDVTYNSKDSALKLGIKKNNSSVNAIIAGSQEVVINDDKADINFRAATQNRSNAIFLDAGTEQLLILSGGAGTGKSPDERNATDMNFFVSGSADSKDSGTKGTALFGGDLHISGNLTVDGSSPGGGGGISWDGSTANGVATFKDASEATVESNLTFDGTNLLIASTGQIQFADSNYSIGDTGTDLAITSNDNLAIAADGGVLNLQGSNQIKLTTSGGPVLILTGVNSGGGSPDESNYSDLIFFVSGSVGSKDTSNPGTALFGGDVVISGSLYGGRERPNKPATKLTVKSPLIVNANQFEFIGTEEESPVGDDIVFSVSGTIGGKTRGEGVTAFGGDMVVSGGLTISSPGVGADVTFYGQDDAAIGLQWDATSDENGRLTLGQNGEGVDFKVFGETASKHLHWDQSADTLYLWGSISSRYDQVFDASSQGWDFTVNSNSRVAIFVDGGEDRIYVLSGGDGSGPTSPDPASFTDTAFFVSGTIGSRQTQVKGASVFGGDLVVSGDLYIPDSGRFYLDTDGAVFNEQGASGADFRVESTSEDRAIWLNASNNKLHFNHGKSSFTTTIWNSHANAFEVNSNGVIFNEQANTNNDFRVETLNQTHGLFVDSSLNQVLIMSSSDTGGTDVSFFVSGTVASKDTGNRGSALIGGDLIISGGLYGGRDRPNKPATKLTIKSPLVINSRIFEFTGDANEGPIANDATFLISGTIEGVHRGEGVTVIGGDTVISGTLYGGVVDYGGGETEEKLTIGTTVEIVGTRFAFEPFDESSGGEVVGPDGDDIVFSVSGSVGGRGQDSQEGNGATAAFGGDVMISGSLLVNRSVVLNMSASSTDDFDVSLASLVPVYKVDTTQTIVTASLPAIPANASYRGTTVIFKDVGGNASSNAIVIEPAAGDEIDAASALKIEANYGAVGLMLDFNDDLSAAHWWTIFNRS